MATVVAILPTTTYKAADFVTAADALGVDLIVASEEPPPFDMGDRYVQIDCSDPAAAAEEIVRIGDRSPIDGVVAADDSGVVVAALASERLGVLGITPESAESTRNKSAMRNRLAAAEVMQPRFGVIDSTEPGEMGIPFPLVLKPLSRAAGQGVVRVDSRDDLENAIRLIWSILGHEEPLLAEELMLGQEVVVEGIVTDGTLTVLAIMDKPDASSGPFFPETILVTPSSLPPESQAECHRVAQAAIEALGLTHGPTHIELMVSDEIVRVIEVAGRSIGGMCSQSLRFGLMGTTLESLVLRNALGMDKPELRRERRASGVLMIPATKAGTLVAISGEEEVDRLDGVTSVEISARPGSRVAPAPYADSYVGFVFASAELPEEVTATLRKAADLISLEVE